VSTIWEQQQAREQLDDAGIQINDSCRKNGLQRSGRTRIGRFMTFVEFSNDGCWVWKGMKNNSGYGMFNKNQKSILAHRFSYETFCGFILEGMFICHSCDNKVCVNPAHLFMGTAKDNTDDMIRKNRHHFWKKLTPHKVIEIRKLLSEGKPNLSIGEMFGVSRSMISAIKKGQAWTHVK
jgi:hypothetical protein